LASSPAPAAGDDPERVGWQRLLAFLGGGAGYELLRGRLIRFFRARGAASPDELADATFDRVARKLAGELDGARLHPAYLFGVARLIWRESLRRERTHRRGVDRLRHFAAHDSDGGPGEHELRLWERCLDELPAGERRLLPDY